MGVRGEPTGGLFLTKKVTTVEIDIFRVSFLCLWILAERLKLGKEIIWVENLKHSVRHTFCLNNFNLHVTRILKNPQSDPHP